VLILLTPIGVLAQGTAWGEWGAEQLRSALGFVPAGLQRLSGIWTAAIPGYAPGFVKNPLLAYLVAAVIGAALVVGVTWAIAKLLTHGSGSVGDPRDEA
jgi:hypothetical protein